MAKASALELICGHAADVLCTGCACQHLVHRLSCAVASVVSSMGKKAAAAAHVKLLRSVSGIAGVSDRGVSEILKWVKDNPAVLDGNIEHQAVTQIHFFTIPTHAW